MHAPHPHAPPRAQAKAVADRGAASARGTGVRLLAWLVPLVAMLIWAGPAPAAEAFNALKGSWSGGGTAKFEGGQSEKLRCSARYTGGGSSLNLSLKCASASAQINLGGQLTANGSRVSGSWSESSFGLSGGAYGTAGANSVRLRISGGAKGFLTLNVSGSRHSVSISTQGTTLRGVNVSLRRR
ncbi:MAG: hypothetical protein ACRCS9_13130 [Hyphomicrobium sp.]